MSILFAIIFLVLIFKCVGLVLSICGKLLGAVLTRIYHFPGDRGSGVWTFYRICHGAAADWNRVAGHPHHSVRQGRKTKLA